MSETANTELHASWLRDVVRAAKREVDSWPEWKKPPSVARREASHWKLMEANGDHLMTTETDIETRVREWRYAYFQGLCRESTYDLTDHVLAEFRRLRQRISELEYRERSRECVGPYQDSEEKYPHWDIEADYQEARDKIDGLESELNITLDVLWRRGDDEAREWIRLNYPTFVKQREGKEELRKLMRSHGPWPHEAGPTTGRTNRPDAVQILREKERFFDGMMDRFDVGSGSYTKYQAAAIAVGACADAFEKERNG